MQPSLPVTYLQTCLKQLGDIQQSLQNDRLTGRAEPEFEKVGRRKKTRIGIVETYAGVHPLTATQELLSDQAAADRLANLRKRCVAAIPNHAMAPKIDEVVQTFSQAHEALLNDAYRASEGDCRLSDSVVENWRVAYLAVERFVPVFLRATDWTEARLTVRGTEQSEKETPPKSATKQKAGGRPPKWDDFYRLACEVLKADSRASWETIAAKYNKRYATREHLNARRAREIYSRYQKREQNHV
jgi:hypothetical protein